MLNQQNPFFLDSTRLWYAGHMYVSGRQISGHIVLEPSTSAQAAFNRLKMGTRQGEEQAAPQMLVEKVHQPSAVGSRTNDPNLRVNDFPTGWIND